MDIAGIQPQERTIEIHHPADETQMLGIRVSLMAISDPRMKKIKRKIQDEKLRLEARGKNFKSEDLEDNQNSLIFSAMTGWDWYGEDVKFEGQKPEFNRVNVGKVLSSLEWFADQLTDAIDDEKAFFKPSKPI